RTGALLPQLHLESFSEDRKFDAEVKEIYRVIKNLITHNKNILGDSKRTGVAKSMLQVLIENMEKEGLSLREVKLVENILQILLASEGTTGTTLFRALHYISTNP